MALAFALSEDRGAEEIGIRLALVSLADHCPGTPVFVYRAGATTDLKNWLKQYPNVQLIPSTAPGAFSWNCKPQTLLSVLNKGFSEVVWIDSDMVLARNCLHLFQNRSDDELVIAPEQVSSAHQGTAARTEAWNLPVGRVFPMTANSSVMRVTRRHIPLLQRWQQMLEDSEYVAFQNRPFRERPLHMMSDQDVLNALLCSRECADVPVIFLRRGLDVIHSGGALAYSLNERLRGLMRPIAPFVHGQGAKPWIMFDPSANLTGWFWFYRRLLQEVSPYLAIARKYRDRVGLPCTWLDRHSILGVACRALGFGHHAIRGLPLTAVASVINRRP